jgi:hypothetical protein
MMKKSQHCTPQNRHPAHGLVLFGQLTAKAGARTSGDEEGGAAGIRGWELRIGDVHVVLLDRGYDLM